MKQHLKCVLVYEYQRLGRVHSLYLEDIHRRAFLNSPEDGRKYCSETLVFLHTCTWRRTAQHVKFLRNSSPPLSILCMSEKRTNVPSVYWLKKLVRCLMDSAGRVSLGGCEFETVWGVKFYWASVITLISAEGYGFEMVPTPRNPRRNFSTPTC
jgi:hypothetical protein